MANILDIFRTHSGHRLLERTAEQTGISENEVNRAFLLALPTLLGIHLEQCASGKSHFQEARKEFQGFIDFIETEDLCHQGEKVMNLLLTANQQDKISSFSKVIGISQSAYEKVLKISCGAIFSILTEITENKSLKREDHCELVHSLAGISTKFDREFIMTLIKNEDSPHLIDSAEKIALDREDDEDEQSILGGYTGGR
ncbi:hypothetical protein C7S20_14855 [Christiangramia fulva]|uniref:Uncharacterized protein n=1 Tax=Christiangramia fulva TaxID=2126553 RepID=A0A2R3Z830_9FLAO|nr:DUF937 domain-containing protein [Christiangramia fulva]AVR46440.1 hypothetical protein C7S20_14855 [Christiangramia fulva]